MSRCARDGRFAPSPSGPLHLGNLRTALLAWLFARHAGARFRLRIEDLDRAASRPEHERSQLRDLAALGLDWDGPVVRQSERFDRYHDAVAELIGLGLTYPCYCTRREVLEAAAAPHEHLPEGAYPGTCRNLSARQRAEREAAGRRPSLRLRAGDATVSLVDRLHGPFQGRVDDFVIRRGDGTPAYNLAVVVDDAAQGIGEVVRGDDLLAGTPRQIYLAGLLELPVPSYAHVPLVLGPDGERLAKRHGAVSLDGLAARGVGPAEVRSILAVSLGLAEPGEPVTITELLDRFDPSAVPTVPWVVDPCQAGRHER
ncbi:MAG: tRNA glutamyl-Q(34) synthetase GluQRS [Acidimicrobiales bacterium]